jgi:hypothetical protein
MNTFPIEIELDPRTPENRGRLTGTYCLPKPSRNLKSVELSVAWMTEGAGSEDTAVHHFEQREGDPAGPPLDSATPVRFSIPLPDGPHSYEGFLIKIRWLVRVRMVDEDGHAWTGEAPFRLGSVGEEPPA